MYLLAKRSAPSFQKTGFTLVELLVVIGVIALLAGILVPSLAKARGHSRRTACLSNLRTLGQSLVMYANDHKERLPNGNPPQTADDWAGTQNVLVAFNRNYVKSPAVFRCPEDNDDVPTEINNADYLTPNSARLSYEFYSVWWTPEKGPKLSKLSRAPGTNEQAPLMWDLNVDRSEWLLPDQNHGPKGANVLYADGHVTWQSGRNFDWYNWPHPAYAYQVK
jgi:prepilin-type N-terminal cleavage/methylation domain-containing protein/prepilin-type processing-associated H-X9-DG protein